MDKLQYRQVLSTLEAPLPSPTKVLGLNAFFWQQENLSSRSVRIGVAKTETKSKRFSIFRRQPGWAVQLLS